MKLLVLPMLSIDRTLWPSISASIMIQAHELAGTSGHNADVNTLFAFSAYLKVWDSCSTSIVAIHV